MNKGITLLSVIPVRAEASEQSEMVTQLLMGERYLVLDKQEKWVKIKILLDNYEGWISNSQTFLISNEEFEWFNTQIQNVNISFNASYSLLEEEGRPLLFPGSILPQLDNSKLIRETFSIEFYNQILSPCVICRQPGLGVELARKFLGSPYLWGGKTPAGIDCSGLAQIVFRMIGILLPRDANQQAELGETVNLISEALPGDLIFCDNEAGKIVHVGIYCGNGEIVHASGKVRMDLVDHHGIYNKSLGHYTHTLRLIKRYHNL